MATPELLNALSPQFAIISVGANPVQAGRSGKRGGATSEETLARLRDSGATIYRTDENGTIRLTSDGEQLWLETEK